MFGELRHLGGAVGREPEHAGALGSIPGEYLVYAGGAVMAPEMAPAVSAALEGFLAGLANWKHGACTSTSRRSPPTRSRSSARSGPRACGPIRATVDPDG